MVRSEPIEDDKRELSRVPCRVVVSKHGRSAPLGEITNLSLDGLFVKTSDALPQGSVIPIAFSLLANGSEIITDVEVVRRNASGIGLKFLNLTGTDIRRLRRYVADINSLVGHQRTVEQLHDSTERVIQPITSFDAIWNLLEKSSKDDIAYSLIPSSRPIREFARLVRVSKSGLDFAAKDVTSLGVDEDIFILYTLEFVSYSFQARISETHGTRISTSFPTSIFYSERRTASRAQTTSDAIFTIPLPWKAGQLATWPICEIGESGLSFLAPVEEGYFFTGTPLRDAEISVRGSRTLLSNATVRHLTPIMGKDGSRHFKVGISYGAERGYAAVTTLSQREVVKSAKFLKAIAERIRGQISYMYHRLSWRGRSKKGDLPYTVVRFPNQIGKQVVGLLSTTFPSQTKVRAPLIIFIPGFGGRKETFSALALTMIHNFRKNYKDLAVLRIDGTNNLGESEKDPGCEQEGRHNLRHSMIGAVSDVIGALAWGDNNRYVEPTSVIVISASFGSIATRHALTLPAARAVTKWIVLMGAADAQSILLHGSGNIDVYGNYQRGIKNGVITIVGCMFDADYFCSDMHSLNVGTLEDSRREMAAIKADITWIVGLHDAFTDPRRVHDIMSMKTAYSREVIEVDAGHLPKSGDEALKQFALLTQRVWTHLYGTHLEAAIPSPGYVAVVAQSEWSRVQKLTPLDTVGYWKQYLIGDDGLGFDVLTLSPEYRDFVQLQAELATPGGKKILDLGAGTGNVSVAIASLQPAMLVSQDLIEEALQKVQKKINPSQFTFRTVVADADGNSTTAIRRWLSGDFATPRELVGRVPGVTQLLMSQIIDKYNSEIHALMRGHELDIRQAVKDTGLSDDCVNLLHDLNLLLRVISGRVAELPASPSLRLLDADLALQCEALPFPEATFDCVVSSLVLSYLKYPEDTLAEVHRVLTPGGSFVLSTMRKDADSSKLYLDLIAYLETADESTLPHEHSRESLLASARLFVNSAAELLRFEEEGVFHFYDERELRLLLQRAGFEGLETFYAFGNPPQAIVIKCRKP